MSTAPKAPVTQRAYTLRLRGVVPNDESWRDALWATHEAVNKGAKAFGDWLLTLRGGLDHSLAQGDNCKDKRVMLALGWLSVEDAEHAPAVHRLALGTDLKDVREKKVLDAFRDILARRGFDQHEITEWESDCRSSLCSAIREDGVWVDRSAAFDKSSCLPGLTRDHARSVLGDFVGGMAGFLSLPAAEEGEISGQAEEDDESKDFVKKASGWLSFNCGEDVKSDKNKIATNLTKIVDDPLDDLLGKSGSKLLTRLLLLFQIPDTGVCARNLKAIRDHVGWLGGPPSKGLKAIQDTIQKNNIVQQDINRLKEKLHEEAVERNNQKDESAVQWANALKTQIEAAVGFKYTKTRFAVMLDHALRRFSSTHTWVKRAEAKRRKFDKDSAKIRAMKEQYAHAVDWLDAFCQQQSTATGSVADGGYQIRKRALGGKSAKAWKAVVQAWSHQDCKKEEDRIEAVGQVQSEWDEDEKFGHTDLFKQLANDDAQCVWRPDHVANSQILIDYVAARTAEFYRTRYKVPMYRHPDALKHPVFCDFGNSRWSVSYKAHKARRAANRQSKCRKKREADVHVHVHVVTLQVLTNGEVASRPFHWASKRLDGDLGIISGTAHDKQTPVSRADRLGRSVKAATGDVEVLNVFNEAHWNGRLQAPRRELERVSRLVKQGKTDEAERAKRRLYWLLTFSPRLQPQGPWIEYGCNQGLYVSGKNVQIGAKREKDGWRGLAYPIWHPANEKGRKGHAKHILSRFPGIRILSVDLGHRFAAACAVWETLSLDAFRSAVSGKKVGRGGTGCNDLFAHVEEAGKNGKTRTVIYRRIGPDTLDGKPHPAPWARLERQFLIRLQGEDETPRKAAPHEIGMVNALEKTVGRVRSDDDRLPFRVDKLMFEAVVSTRRALRRHGDRARIAFIMAAEHKPMPGGKKLCFDAKRAQSESDEFDKQKTQADRDEAHVDYLTDALELWHGLATSDRWVGKQSQSLWKEYIEEPYRVGLEKGPAADKSETSSQRKKRCETLRQSLKGVSQKLVKDAQQCQKLHAAWAKRWREDDRKWGGKHREQENGRAWSGDVFLRRLHRWILPRAVARIEERVQPDGKRKLRRVVEKTKRGQIRHVGGLSLTRINTLTGLYRLLKAYRMRPEPDDLRKNVPEKGDDALTDFHRRLLETRDRMRDQRVKQLASRIAEAALGIGRYKRPKRKPGEPAPKDPKRPTQRVHKPCHAVVIENLTYYRPDELRTRRENRQLMDWSSSKVKKFLAEACQLHGLHLREVSPAYTSRQDSRTGMPGARCRDVPVEKFLAAPWWRRQVNQAKKKRATERNARECYLVDLDKQWSQAAEDQRKGQALRIPNKGGDIFVSAAEPGSGEAKGRPSGIQADLNAAANVGLKALMDPDWPGRWWYVPCSASDGEPVKDKVGGCRIIPMDKSLRTASASADEEASGDGAKKGKTGRGKQASSRKSGRTKEIVNYWRHPSSHDVVPASGWLPTKEYWKAVEERVIGRLRPSANLEKKG